MDSEGKRIKGVIEKAGIRTILKRDGRPQAKDMWVNVDLDNMEHLMESKEIDIFQKFNYREQKDDYSFSLGKVEIISKITRFFSEEGRTKFVLYYSGHGDENGSWCFPRSFLPSQNGNSTRTSTPASDAAATTVPESNEVSVEVHQAAVDDDEEATPDEIQRAAASNESIVSVEVVHQAAGDDDEVEGGSTEATPDEIPRAAATSPYLNESLEYLEAKRQQPPPTPKTNDLLTFEDVIKIWDEKRQGQPKRYLMIILDCCFSGRWIEKLKRERDAEDDSKIRGDICIQAACQPFEKSNVADSQEGSVFTKYFVAAQSQTLFKKLFLSLIDHFMVLQFVTIANDPFRGSLNYNRHIPMCTQCAPFAGIQFFDTFEDMYLTT